MVSQHPQRQNEIKKRHGLEAPPSPVVHRGTVTALAWPVVCCSAGPVQANGNDDP
jgi:hypothetical protein